MAYDGTAAPGYTNAGYSQDGMNMWTINQDVPSPGGVQQSTESLPPPIYTIGGVATEESSSPSIHPVGGVVPECVTAQPTPNR